MEEFQAVRCRRLLAVGMMFFVTASSGFAAERWDDVRQYFGTSVRATICYPMEEREKARSAMDALWQKFSELHAHMNAFDPSSDVSLLNASSGRTIKVHDDVYVLLTKSKNYAGMTAGVFDITVGPLMSLWKRAGKMGRMPTATEVREAKMHVGTGRIELLKNGYVRVPEGVKIDLGGDAAGFAADQGADIFLAAGFKDFLVDAGGEIYASGRSCEGRPWRIGIRDPEGRNRVADLVVLKDQAVSTSGSYEKYIEINGERWPHIVNPLTGYPERGVISATVIAPRAVEADVLSTALCILGPGAGLKLVDSLGSGYAAMIIVENESGKIQENMTSGYAVLRVK